MPHKEQGIRSLALRLGQRTWLQGEDGHLQADGREGQAGHSGQDMGPDIGALPPYGRPFV